MNTLDQWEGRLKPYYQSGLRWIGEIPLSFSDVAEMAEAVKHYIALQGLPRASQMLAQNYPLTLITLMAGFSAYNTQQNYWQAFADQIGADKNNLYNHGWHRNFVRLAKERKLKVFDYSDDPLPYVTSIRFQGGIPVYSLADYFEKMVLPSVQRSGLREVPAKQALDHLIDNAYGVDSPVLDFFKNSGELGVEFYAASRKLALYALENHGAIPPTGEVDLPEYVVHAFREYWEHREDALQHWHMPYLQADPYSSGTPVILVLPQQEITVDLAAARLFWMVTYPVGGSSQELSCRVSRSRRSAVTQEIRFPILEPVQRIVVSIYVIQEESGEKRELRRWNFFLIPAEGMAPLVAFNAQGIQITTARQLPAEELYLLTPRNTELVFDGKERGIEESLPLEGAWRGWKIDHLDISQVWAVLVTRAWQTVGDVIPVHGVIAMPELTDGHLFQFQDLEEPLYTSSVPSVKVPLHPGSSPQARLHGWKVRVRSSGEAAPAIDREIHLGDFASRFRIEGDWGIFPLETILGESPAGTYEIRVDGPRDLDADFRVRLWPKLILAGHSMHLVQPDKDPKPSVFFLRLQEGAGCEVQDRSQGIDIQPTSGGWKITAPPELNRVMLYLTAPSDGGGQVRLPVSIPLPKPCWALTSEREPGVLEWGQGPLRRSIAQLLQGGSAALHVEMYGLSRLLSSLKLRLIELGEGEHLLQEARWNRSGIAGDWLRVSLGQFRDSVRAINSLARFELVYTPAGGDLEPVCIPLVELSRELDIRQARLAPLGKTSWKLTWLEERPLNNRRVMIKPAWQPWQAPLEYKIPNDAQGEFMIDDIGLPPSRYHLYFYIRPDYEAPLQDAPSELHPHVIDLCTPQERLEALPVEGPASNGKFRNLLEKANIHHDLGEREQRDLTISQAATYLIHLTDLPLLISTLKWIRDKDIDLPIKSFFFNAMFSIRIVEAVFRIYNLNDPALQEYLSYTSQVKNIHAESAKLILRRVDEPIVIASCLRALIARKDSELSAIMIMMIRESRLSTRDTLDYLSKDPVWAIEQLAALPSSPDVDRLIGGLLPKVSHIEEYREGARLAGWIKRAIPFIEDVQLIQAYLRYLFEVMEPKPYQLLMQRYLDNKIDEKFIQELLSIDPKTALAFLEDLPESDRHQEFIEWLIDQYPTLSGYVSPGCRLKTPFGIAVIDRIEGINSGEVNRIRLGDRDYCLNVLARNGAERVRLHINYHNMTINIEGETSVWQCWHCGYMHPDYHRVHKHIDKGHSSMRLSEIPLPLSFDLNDVSIVLDREPERSN